MKFKNKLIFLLLTTALCTGCVSSGLNTAKIDNYDDNDHIIAITPKGALNILQSNPDIKTRNSIYKIGVLDKEESKKALSFHNKYWNKIENTDKYKEMKKNWRILSFDKKINFLQELINGFCKYVPDLEKNGFNPKTIFKKIDPEAKLRPSYNKKKKKMKIIIVYDFNMIIRSLKHELTHATDHLVTLPFQKNSINKKLIGLNIKDNYIHYDKKKKDKKRAYQVYSNQPVEKHANIIKNNDIKALEGPSIFINPENKSFTIETILKSNALMSALNNDGVLYKHEIKKEELPHEEKSYVGEKLFNTFSEYQKHISEKISENIIDPTIKLINKSKEFIKKQIPQL